MKEKSIGYIRTNCWSKVSSLFDGKQVTSLKLKRSISATKVHPTGFNCIKISLHQVGKLELDWDCRKNKVSFLNIADEIERLKVKHQFGDFVVEEVQTVFIDETFNNMISATCGKVVPEGTPFFITFGNTPLSTAPLDSVNREPIRLINSISINMLKFKLGVLDVKKVTSEGFDLGYVSSNKQLLRYILTNCIHTGGWFQLPEVAQLSENYQPGAIRTYELRTKNRWVLVKDEEV